MSSFQGVLKFKTTTDRWRIVDDVLVMDHELTSGETLEVKLGEDWVPGRMEYDHREEAYYFTSKFGDIYALHGMEARMG